MEFGTQDYWIPRRKELLSWFKRNEPSLAELYEGAVIMIFSEKFPARVCFVAHAVREIRNRLPDVIAGPEKSQQLQYKNRLDSIAEIWKKYGLPSDGSLPITVTEQESLPSHRDAVPIPTRVYKEVAALVHDHVRTREKPLETAKRLFQGIDPKNRESEATLWPRIHHWINTTEWFVERAHYRKINDRKEDEELKRRFERFEASLSAMVGEFFKTVEELDAILQEANS